ncbi:MAG TPA: arsenical efflux pump membrane protein ArsB [Symbiobacteriaceae bacterium]|jgi:arsenical pump membrane protein|nr:arsenical efflux pump membrane protein ArsB [Symbiobacteriaceae bacterium]
MSQAVAAPAIFAFTLYLVLARPRNLDTGLAALIGALLALAAGVITLVDVRTVAGIVWDATFALIAIVVISVVLDQAGLFRWAALQLARRAGGNGRTIFLAVIGLGAVVSTLFTNDATVLILTPIVYEMLAALGFDHRMILPYMMACGFVADTMSIPLAVSNLTNMITARYFALGFGRFALLMLLPSVVCLGTTVLVLRWYYRREIPASYDQHTLPDPASAIRDPFLFRVGLGVLGAMVVTFFINSLVISVPVSVVIATGAAVLLMASFKNRVVRASTVIRQAPWHVVIFALGMYLVVYGVGNAGLTAWSARLLERLVAMGPLAAIVGTGVLVALFSSLMNNLPGVMLGCLALAAAGASGAIHEGMILANVIGSDIGPKLTPIGSLATLIWLHSLQRKGMKITWQSYLKVGLLITPPVLLATLGALWLSVRLFG